MTSSKAWFAGVVVLLVIVSGMAVVGLRGASDSMQRLLDVAASTETRTMSAPGGSVVLLGNDTIATVIDILGIRGGIAGADSIMVYRSALSPTVAINRLARDGVLVGLLEPIRDWTLPITIRLEQPRSAADTAQSHGRVAFLGSDVSLPVFVSRKPQ